MDLYLYTYVLMDYGWWKIDAYFDIFLLMWMDVWKDYDIYSYMYVGSYAFHMI